MRWISIKEKLPEFNVGVLVSNGEVWVAAELVKPFRLGELRWGGHECGGYEWDWDFETGGITHWKPGPELPKKKEKKK